jgi:predicted RND superfamily exporter protein
MEDTLDSSLPSVKATREVETKFSSGTPLQIVFYNEETSGLPEGALCRIKLWLERDIYSLPGLTNLNQKMSPFEIRLPKIVGDRLWFPPLFKPACDRSEPAPIAGYVNSSLEVNQLVNRSPWQGIMSAEIGSSDFLVELSFAGGNSKNLKYFNSDTTFIVDRSLKSALAEFPEVKWHFNGAGAFRAYAKQSGEIDMGINALIPIVLTLLYRLIFGSWRGGILLALSLFVMRSLLLGSMALLGYKADPLTGCLITLVSLSTVEDFLFVSAYQMNQGASWKQSYQRFLIPSLLTSLTTAIGFASLMISNITTVRDLGLWATIGCFLQWWIIYFLLPAIHKVFPKTGQLTRTAGSGWRNSITNLASKSLPSNVRWLVYGVFIASSAAIPFIKVEDSLDRFFPSDHPFSESIRHLQKSRNWESVIELSLDKSMSTSEKTKLLSTLSQSPFVTKIDTGEKFLSYLTAGVSPLESDLVRRLAATDDVYKRYFSSDGSELWHIFVNQNSVSATEQFMNYVREVCPLDKCQLSGALPIFVDFSSQVVKSLFESFAASLLLVILFLCFYLWWTKTKNYFSVIFSSMFGPIIMMGLLSALHIPVNFVSCFFAAILVGLAGDNAIQYVYSSKGRKLECGIKSCSNASIIITLAMISIALLLLCSSFLPPRSLGVILSLGLLINLIGDFWLLKLLLKNSAV